MKKKLLLTALSILGATAFLASCSDEKEDDYKLKIVTPGQAPLLGIAETIADNKSNVDLDNSILIEEPKNLAGHFIAGAMDIIVAPVNAGAKLYNAGKSTYKLAGILTWGNQFFASQNQTFTIDSLNNKEITIFGEKTVNELELDIVLNEKGINVTKTYVANAGFAMDTLLADANAMVLTAEPALTAKKGDKSIISYSLNDLYKEVTTYDAPQAAVFVSENAYSKHKELIEDFLEDLEEETAEIINDTKDAIEAFTSLGGSGVPAAAIPGSKIKFKSAQDSKAALQYLVSKDIERDIPATDKIFGKQMDDEFYI